MKLGTKACLFGGALFAAGISAHAGNTYRLDGPNATAAPNSYGYSWDGAYMAPFRAAIQVANNFGHYFARVDTSIVTGDFAYLNVTVLERADGIISPWWWDSDITASEQYIAAFHFSRGGDLFLFQDSSYTDAIGAYLGIPTTNGPGFEVISGTSFPFTGPFGPVPGAAFAGSVGFLTAADVTSAGGTVLATNSGGQPVIAFWDDGDYAPGAGRMLIVTDINSIGDAAGTAQYTPLNDNGRFALNLFAGMIADGPPACPADTNGDGLLTLDDIDAFVTSFLSGCP